MAKNEDTLFRQWHMLRLVPRYPGKITVQDIHGALGAEGFEITERSIQRDLKDLSTIFPLLCDEREKPFGWSWHRDVPSFDLPGLTTAEALTLAMVEQYLRDLLPMPMVDLLQPYFQSAHKRLDAEPRPHRSRSWLDKVRTVPPTQPLLPPKVDPEVQRILSDALLHERQVNIHYRRRGDRTPKEMRIHPLAMVQRGPILYLYCRIFDYDDPRTLALHRVMSASLLDEPVSYPAGYSIDRQVELGTWGFGSGEKIEIELRFNAGHGNHLYETPLSKDQVIEELEAGTLRVRATVADTPQLQWWLLGFGQGVEVISPPSLRGALASTASALAMAYR